MRPCYHTTGIYILRLPNPRNFMRNSIEKACIVFFKNMILMVHSVNGLIYSAARINELHFDLSELRRIVW